MLFLLSSLALIFGNAEAQLLLGLIGSILVPIVTALLARPNTNKWVKLALAITLSAVAGTLTVFIAGGLTGSAILAGGAIFAASQVWFASWFKGLNLKDYLEGLGDPIIDVELEEKQ